MLPSGQFDPRSTRLQDPNFNEVQTFPQGSVFSRRKGAVDLKPLPPVKTRVEILKTMRPGSQPVQAADLLRERLPASVPAVAQE